MITWIERFCVKGIKRVVWSGRACFVAIRLLGDWSRVKRRAAFVGRSPPHNYGLADSLIWITNFLFDVCTVQWVYGIMSLSYFPWSTFGPVLWVRAVRYIWLYGFFLAVYARTLLWQFLLYFDMTRRPGKMLGTWYFPVSKWYNSHIYVRMAINIWMSVLKFPKVY